MPNKTVDQLEELSGIIERITFYNESNGFCVLKIQPTGAKASIHQSNLITVVGVAASITAGEFINCTGNWTKNNIHGLQFQAKTLTLTTPNTINSIEKYLSSGLIKGIGPSFAKKLVATLGANVFEIIENEPTRLLEIPGIGTGRYKQIIDTWATQKEVRKIIVFLHEHGIGTARAVKIYKIYKEQAIPKIKENPYRLALDIHGIGFKIADNLALSLGIPRDSIIRAEAGLSFILQQSVTEGNCAMGLQDLINATMQQLEISIEVIQNAIEREILAKHIVLEIVNQQELIFLKKFHTAECYAAKQMFLLNQGKPYWHNLVDLDQAIINIEKYSKIKFSNSQLLAIRTAVTQKTIIITGGPGVGKTTVAKSILNIIAEKTNKILLAAPTGKAAKRLSESTHMPAITLHRMLAFDPTTYKFKYNEDNLLDVKLVLIDEVSMIDLFMFTNLLKALPLDCALILMGDVDQLPSVGAGSVLADLMGSDCIRTVKLQEIFRQSSTSQIIINAHRINNGQLPFLENYNKHQDFYFIKLDNPNDLPNKLIQIIARIEKNFALKFKQDLQILSPMNKGIAGVINLNNILQKQFNLNAQNPKNIITRFGNNFAIGDKIIQLVNNYDKDIFNGDIGIIDTIDFEDSSLAINFDGKLINYDFDELDEIALAYAITIHKAQGSEYPAIIMPICLQHFNLLQKNLIYTGVTRGKNLVILIGELKALTLAVKNINCKPRITTLKERLARI